ncbi:MAG: type II toxin-antitoxin system VapC family toxin [Actinomycetota bacterium]|nr:type II toxin-antitoxin system VapC family toxin [Actinomycetota bacterium]
MDFKENGEQLDKKTFLVSESSINSFDKGELLIPDTSVIVKWFFKDNEKNKEKADIILGRYMDNKIKIIAPELAVFELANVLKNKLGKYKSEQLEIIDKLYNMGIIFYIDMEILKRAVEIAIDIKESVYDGIFLATAEYFNGKFITDDNKLFLNYSNYKKKKIKIITLDDYSC